MTTAEKEKPLLLEKDKGRIRKALFSKDYKVIAGTWWCMLVVPSSQEAEARGCLEPMSSRSAGATQEDLI